MKRLWLPCGVLAALLLISLSNGRYVKQLTDDMVYQLTCAQQMSLRQQWNTAARMTQSAYDNWQSHHSYLHIVMRHSDTDQICRSFQEVMQYLQIHEFDQYLAANADLIAQLGLLSEMEQPSFVNVL